MRSRVLLTTVTALATVSGCAAEPTVSPVSPPPGPSAVIDARVPGWQTSAWLTEEAFCLRTVRTDRKREEGRENEAVFCDPAPEALKTSGPPLLPMKPLPQLWPLDPQQRDILLVGTVRGPVAEVSVTMFNRTATTTVHPLPATGARKIGAYAVWLPRAGAGQKNMTLSDITAVIGRDATGTVVTRLDE